MGDIEMGGRWRDVIKIPEVRIKQRMGEKSSLWAVDSFKSIYTNANQLSKADFKELLLYLGVHVHVALNGSVLQSNLTRFANSDRL